MPKSNEEIRQAFLHEEVCAVERGQYATDTSFMGFEDPRSAAIGDNHRQIRCGRKLCRAVVNVNIMKDSMQLEGTCKMADLCAKKVKEEDDPDGREKELIKRASSEVLAFICPRVACTFNYGFTIDGGSGQGGECLFDDSDITE